MGELVAVLARQFSKALNRNLDVRIGNQLTASAAGKTRSVSVVRGGQADAPGFSKGPSGSVLYSPSQGMTNGH